MNMIIVKQQFSVSETLFCNL